MSQRTKRQLLHGKKKKSVKKIKESLQATTPDKARPLTETSPNEKCASYLTRKFSKSQQVPNLKILMPKFENFYIVNSIFYDYSDVIAY